MPPRLPLTFLLLAALVTGARGARPEHVFLLSIDGLRSDLLEQAETPHLDLLIKSGCRAVAARTVKPAVTLPAHASMLSGVTPKRHGFLFNRHTPERGRLQQPTVLGLAAAAGRSVAAFLGKRKLLQLMPESGVHVQHAGYHDAPVMRRATAYIRKHKPQLTFIHLPDVDAAGHSEGWGTPEQLQAVEAADVQVGELFRVVHESGILPRSTFLVTADHGGHGKAHGVHHPREFQIEWIAGGLGFHPGHAIEAPVSVLDTLPTLLTIMELPVPEGLDGRVVAEALYFGDRDVKTRVPTQLGLTPEALLPGPAGSLPARTFRTATTGPTATPPRHTHRDDRPAREPQMPWSAVEPPPPREADQLGLIPPLGRISELAQLGLL